MLAHTVQGVTTNITLRSQDMNGALVDAQGNTVDEFEADINSHGDIFSVGDILRVANGVDLDGRLLVLMYRVMLFLEIKIGSQPVTSDVPASEPENTLRYDGIVLVMYIR